MESSAILPHLGTIADEICVIRSMVSTFSEHTNANYFLLDGTTNTDPTFNTQNISLSPDTVREFQVQTGSYAAEMGGAGGQRSAPFALYARPRESRMPSRSAGSAIAVTGGAASAIGPENVSGDEMKNGGMR